VRSDRARFALQSLRLHRSPPKRFRRAASSRSWLLVQSSSPVAVSQALFPRSHFAVGRFLGYVVFLRRVAPVTVKQQARSLFEFHLPSEFCLTQPSRPTAVSRLLSWALLPFSTRGLGGPLATGFTGLLRSAHRVWLPSRRLTPSAPWPAFFHAGGAPGIRPSELSPPERCRPRFRGDGPTCRLLPPVFPSRRIGLGRPSGPRLLGFNPFESPWRPLQGWCSARWMLPWALPS
jgi:hypothetical protein